MSVLEVWEAYYGYIKKIALGLWRRIPIEDRMQEAFFGVEYAHRTFDPTKGRPFATYLCWGIHGRLRVLAAKMNWPVRVPAKVHREVLARYREEHTLPPILHRISTGQFGSTPDLELWTDRKMQPTDEAAIDRHDARELRMIMRRTLDARACAMLSIRYGLNGPRRTLARVGDMCALSRERVGQLCNRYILQLREAYAAAGRGSNLAVS